MVNVPRMDKTRIGLVQRRDTRVPHGGFQLFLHNYTWLAALLTIELDTNELTVYQMLNPLLPIVASK